MLSLSTFGINNLSPITLQESLIARISTNMNLPKVLRADEILLIKDQLPETLPDGFKAYFLINKMAQSPSPLLSRHPNVFTLPADQEYLEDGDVLRFDPQRLSIRTLYRKNSNHNSLLVTEQCNNYCLMCSQPPKKHDDSYIIDELLKVIPLMDENTKELGITGGEPTIIGERLLDILGMCKSFLPRTSIHMLSNGRSYSNLLEAKRIASLKIHDLMIGIPVYSDVASIHDYVVQAKGAFDETIQGIINLKRYKVPVEIRVVIHQQTYERLPQLADFITRNLLFVDHVALMGLEMTGFARANKDILRIDPLKYKEHLAEAVYKLNQFKMNVSIYNHPLCTIDKGLWPFNKKSISDWKNHYLPECGPCVYKEKCGGLFSTSSLPLSDTITPFLS